MNVHLDFRLRIAVITTRDLSAQAGRPGILSRIVHTLRQRHDVTVYRLSNVILARGISHLASAALAGLAGLVCLRPVPLQCLLYASSRECSQVARKIRDGKFDVVYLDTVRCLFLLRELRRIAPQIHVVADFDDLMSRRMEQLVQNRLPFLAGHVANAFPRWLRRFAEGPLARLITKYEAHTLRNAEQEAIAKSDNIVLVSPAERDLARSLAPPELRKRLHTISPMLAIRASPWPLSSEPRFVFVGSDELLQNRLAIDILLQEWRTLRPAAVLHIYGRQTRPMQAVPGVQWHGFVDDLSEVYASGTIALLPAVLSGGVKTKVAEAWAWGCPVLVNAAGLEGYSISGYPLEMPERDWAPLILCPSAHGQLWHRAARIGQEFVRRNFSHNIYEQAWECAIRPEAPKAMLHGSHAVVTMDRSLGQNSLGP